ncbi:MAG: phosphatidylserine decarboxylase family protein [Methanosarcinaceae archaeon]
MAKEGRLTVILILASALILSGISAIFPWMILIILSILAWLLAGFMMYFFRDPTRTIPDVENAILSPADGQVLSIEEIEEDEFLHQPVNKISIFMSPLNVHINRIPISGQVDFLRYQPGKFLAAYRPESSAENEQAVIGITGNGVNILFKQIAGILARRIVCGLAEGEQVKIGEKFGLIKLGSRVEVYLPKKLKVTVELNQRVTGGESILGVIENGK